MLFYLDSLYLGSEMSWSGNSPTEVIYFQWLMKSKLKWPYSVKARESCKWPVMLSVCFSVCSTRHNNLNVERRGKPGFQPASKPHVVVWFIACYSTLKSQGMNHFSTWAAQLWFMTRLVYNHLPCPIQSSELHKYCFPQFEVY